MDLICLSEVHIKQYPSSDFPDRSQEFNFNFFAEYDVLSGWPDLTSKGKIKFPKNIWVKDKNGNTINLGGEIGGDINNLPINAPLGKQPAIVMRGDFMTLKVGYGYFDTSGNPKIIKNQLAANWVSKVANQLLIEIDYEDHMYLLKQVQAPNKVWGATQYTLESMMTELLDLVNTVKADRLQGIKLTLANNPQVSTKIGDFRTQNETVCQVLERLQKTFKFESFFRGSQLHCGCIVYYPGEGTEHSFVFEKNIVPGDSLNYTRADDIQLSLTAYSVNKTELLTTTKSGRLKTKKQRLEVTITNINGEYVEVNTKDPKQKESLGQMRTMFFWDIQTAAELKTKAISMLRRLYYEGYRGKFTTFALPFVQHGDIAVISSIKLPERYGKYFVKSVRYFGSPEGGMWQEVELDLRIDGVLTDEQLLTGL
jgi:hypothetical protein